MRVSPRRALTWIGILFFFFMLMFNFYNRNVWVYETSSKPWGPNFDSEIEHNRVHHPKWRAAQPNDAVRNFVNITTVAKEIDFRRQQLTSVTLRPEKPILLPNVHKYNDDRILSQLSFRGNREKETTDDAAPAPLKKVLVYAGMHGWDVKPGQRTFLDQKCQVNTCLLYDRRQDAASADAILFHHNAPSKPWAVRPPHQLWILYMLESPYHTPSLSALNNVINMTATYRHDSDIVAPYEKFVPFDPNVLTLPQNKSFAAGKTKQVAWFVSNCGARNGRREYANELAKHISVDIYGACGTLSCPRKSSLKCFEMLNKDYKFYLAFENSNCRDYITEKFFVNGLQHDVIPIVMGGAPEDYERAAPPHSFIHVDQFESAKDLADYLIMLDKNDDLFNEYFRWKGTGHFINTFFWCRLCAMIHDQQQTQRSYSSVEQWWRGEDICINKNTWRQRPRKSNFIYKDHLLT